MTTGRSARFRSIAALLVVCFPRAARGAGDEPEVEVRGARLERAPRDDTAASSVVSREELTAPGASASDVLARVPGVEVARTGSSSDLSTASIRGATSAETPIYLAGVRLNDDVTGTADLSTLPLRLLDRVEVYRGNAPLDADRLGIGGAIFFEPRFPTQSEISGGFGLGSFGERQAFATGAAAGKHAAALVALRRDGAEQDYPFKDDAGQTRVRRNADYTSTDAWNIARYDLGGAARVTTVLHAYDREQGSPGLAAAPNDFARTHTRRLLGAATVRLPCGRDASGAESCSAEFVTSALLGRSTLTDPLAQLDAASLVSTSAERFEEQGRITAHLGDAFTVGGGLSVARDGIDVDRPEVASVRAARTTTRPAASLTWHASPHVDVVGLGSVECHATSSAGASTGACEEREPGGRLGAAYRLSDWLTLRGNVGRYGRVPTLGELYGVSAVVQGNPKLHSETGETADLGFHVRTRPGHSRADFDAFGFVRTADDLVAYRQKLLGVVAPYNVGRARIFGAELASDADLWGMVGNTLSMTLMDARDTTPDRTIANDILPFRSRLVFSDFAELHTNSPFHALDRAGLGLRLTHRSSRYADSGGLIVIAAQTTMDVEASATFLRSGLSARIAFRNVLDAREVDTVGLPLPGRSAYGTLEATWR